MAAVVELVNEPGPVNGVDSCLKWTFVVSGVSNDLEENRFVYWLEDATGQMITHKEQLVPAEGKEFPIDLLKDVRDVLYTPPPPYEDLHTTIVEVPSMIGDYVLHVQIHTYDRVLCQSAITSDLLYGWYRVISVASDWATVVIPGDPGVINYKSPLIYVAPKSNDWLYCYGNVEIEVVFYSSTGTQLDDPVTINVSGEVVNVVPIGPDNLRSIFPADCKYYTVHVNGDKLTTYVVECSTHNRDIYFFDNGYSVLNIPVASTGLTTSQSTVNLYNPNCSPLSNTGLLRKGLSINNKKANLDYNFNGLLKYDTEEELEYIKKMLTSGSYFVQVPFLGTMKMIKFIVNPGSVTYDIKEEFVPLQISGYINRSIPTANALV